MEMPDKSGEAQMRSNGGVIEPTNEKDIVQCPAISARSLISLVSESRLRKVLQRIESGPPQSVSALAREVRLSPAHLQRLFKQETGVHISDLLVEHRLRNAAQLLSTTDMEIKEIAYKVGYQHHSSFVRAFRRRFHQSPKRYRRPPAA
jgi:transcriptional regulator GlxA family with amidase domain